MSDHIAMEFSEIAAYLTVGTSLCCEHHAEKLRNLGAQIDISLEYERTEIPGMFSTFLWLPVPDMHAPSVEQLDVGTAMIAEAELRGYRAYVHCRNGHGRGPTLAIAYFIRKGMNPADAEALVRKGRPEIEPTAEQRARLDEYAEKRRS